PAVDAPAVDAPAVDAARTVEGAAPVPQEPAAAPDAPAAEAAPIRVGLAPTPAPAPVLEDAPANTVEISTLAVPELIKVIAEGEAKQKAEAFENALKKSDQFSSLNNVQIKVLLTYALENARAKMSEIVDKLNIVVKDELIINPAVSDELARELHPLIKQAESELGLARVNGQYVNTRNKSLNGTYTFTNAEPDKIHYFTDNNKTRQSVTVSKGKPIPKIWEFEKTEAETNITGLDADPNPNYQHLALTSEVRNADGLFTGIDIPNSASVNRTTENIITVNLEGVKLLISLVDGSFVTWPENPADERVQAALQQVHFTVDGKQRKTRKGDQYASLATFFNRKYKRGDISSYLGEKDTVRAMTENLIKAVEQRLNAKVAEVATIGQEVAKEVEDDIRPARSIALRGPVQSTSSGRNYVIQVDGQDTPYLFVLQGSLHDNNLDYGIGPNAARVNKINISDNPEEVKTETVKAFQEILENTPQKHKVKDVAKANFDSTKLKVAESTLGSDKKLEDLTVEQYQAYKKTIAAIEKTIESGEDEVNIWRTMEALSKEHQAVFAASPIQRIKLKFETPAPVYILWEPGNKTQPFGNPFEGGLTVTQQISEIKAAQLGGRETEDFKAFEARGVTAGSELEREVKRQARAESMEYQNASLDMTKEHKLNAETFNLAVGDSEEEIADAFTNYTNAPEIIGIMSAEPFGLTREQVPDRLAKMVSEDGDDYIKFEDIFKFMEEFPAIDRKVIPRRFLRSAEAFSQEFNRLKTWKTPSKEERAYFKAMYEKVIVPCMELIKALQRTRLIKKPTYRELVDTSELPEQQQQIRAALKKLTHTGRIEGWSFLVWLADGKNNITMSDIDGKTFTRTRGEFHDHYDSDSAQSIMENINTS
ncbi:hypothetical protein HY605_01175, partial [Candidatus Peregrinibacteria bacterium]|nr:hypothetical protein [Candidatus Peregrinibacteria bacterium]